MQEGGREESGSLLGSAHNDHIGFRGLLQMGRGADKEIKSPQWTMARLVTLI